MENEIVLSIDEVAKIVMKEKGIEGEFVCYGIEGKQISFVYESESLLTKRPPDAGYCDCQPDTPRYLDATGWQECAVCHRPRR